MIFHLHNLSHTDAPSLDLRMREASSLFINKYSLPWPQASAKDCGPKDWGPSLLEAK